MANEFKIKKGLIVTGASGGTVVDIQGSQGQLFSVTDDLSGSIFAVSDISGVPILDVNSSGLSTFDGNVNLPDSKKILLGTGNDFQLYHDGTHGVLNNTTGNLYTSALGSMMFRTSLNVTALTLDASQNATFAGDVTVEGSHLKILNHTGAYEGAGTDYLYVGGSGLDGTDGAIYLGNSGDGTGYGWRFFYLGSGSGNGNKLIIRSENAGSGVDALSFTQDGYATFATQAYSSATSSGDGSSTLTTKGYVESLITGATIYRGAWDPSGGGYGSPDLSGVTQTSGYYYICSADGAATPNGPGTEPNTWAVGDWVIYNDVSGTGQWQKIDNSSVLSGVGTGQTVALWEGAGSVTDSETLGNAPITVSGSDTTFTGAGAVIATGLFRGDTLNNQANTHNMIYRSGTTTFIAGGDKLVVEDGGYVGVGIADPISKFQVVDTDFPQVRINDDNGAGESGIRLRSTDGTDDYHADIVANSTGGAAGYLAFRSNHSNERMRINSTGSIQFNAYGAGTLVSDASGNITVSSGGGAGGPYLPLTGGTIDGTLIIDTDTGSQPFYVTRSGGTNQALSIYTDDVASYFTTIQDETTGTHGSMAFILDDGAPSPFYNFGYGSSSLLRIEAGGNVGIGTTNPASTLTIKATVDSRLGGIGLVSNDSTNQWTIDAPNAGNLRIYKGTTAVARFDSLGNFGIGTTNPEAKLSVSDGGQAVFEILPFTNDYGTTLRSYDTVDETFNYLSYKASTHIFNIGDAEKMRIDSAGNVGIGETNPGAKLDVNGITRVSGDFAGTGQNPLIQLYNTDTSLGANQILGDIDFYQSDTSGGGAGVVGRIRSINDSSFKGEASLTFSTGESGVSFQERMRINSSGNVGIGTVGPTEKLEVRGGAVRISSPLGNDSGTLAFGNYLNAAGYYDNGIFRSALNDISTAGNTLHMGSYQALAFTTSVAALGSQAIRMYIRGTDGNVGIGTTSPGGPLDVNGRIISRNDVFISSAYPRIWLNDTNNNSDYSIINGNGTLRIYDDTNSTDRFVINSAGNVGIGVTGPKAKLDVNGHFCVDSKVHTITNAFTTCLTVNLTSHTGCYVTLTCFGDWGSHSSAAYRGEFFLQNGANGYAEPGIILRQDDNTSDGTDQIVCQIVDPTSTANQKDFQIQIRHTDTTSPASWTGQLTYTVQGKFNSIT